MAKWLVCALVLCASQVSVQFTKPTFSGTWQLDPEKSTSKKWLKGNSGPDAPPAPADARVPLEIIKHREPNLTILRPLLDGTASLMMFTTDGKENLNHVAGGAIRQRSKSHWDRNELVTEWELLRDGKVFMHGKEVRSLSADWKKMIVDRNMADSSSESVVHAEWKKQPSLLLLEE